PTSTKPCRIRTAKSGRECCTARRCFATTRRPITGPFTRCPSRIPMTGEPSLILLPSRPRCGTWITTAIWYAFNLWTEQQSVFAARKKHGPLNSQIGVGNGQRQRARCEERCVQTMPARRYEVGRGCRCGSCGTANNSGGVLAAGADSRPAARPADLRFGQSYIGQSAAFPRHYGERRSHHHGAARLYNQNRARVGE